MVARTKEGMRRTQVVRPGGVVVRGDGRGRVDEEELHGAARQYELVGALAVPPHVAGRQRRVQLHVRAATFRAQGLGLGSGEGPGGRDRAHAWGHGAGLRV